MFILLVESEFLSVENLKAGIEHSDFHVQLFHLEQEETQVPKAILAKASRY